MTEQKKKALEWFIITILLFFFQLQILVFSLRYEKNKKKGETIKSILTNKIELDALGGARLA